MPVNFDQKSQLPNSTPATNDEILTLRPNGTTWHHIPSRAVLLWLHGGKHALYITTVEIGGCSLT
jgi:hypothetical protein